MEKIIYEPYICIRGIDNIWLGGFDTYEEALKEFDKEDIKQYYNDYKNEKCEGVSFIIAYRNAISQDIVFEKEVKKYEVNI